MKTRHIIFLALAGFLLLFYITVKKAVPRIEKNITTQACAVLASRGFADVYAHAKRLDLILTGKVKTQPQIALLDSLFQDFTGVRKIINQVLVVPDPIVIKKLPHLRLFYKPNTYAITFTHEIILKQLLKLLSTGKHLTIQIKGYTDKEGDEKYNLLLSEKRAQKVSDYLVAQGIPDDRISLQYFGEADSETGSASKKEQAKNRKVDVIIAEVK
ncbi:MAG TPA: OmpA family protein [bacterium]|nr:OmpA family protein [bacterium]HPN43482.1 OmpA family protein [bacterium]